MNGLGEEVGAIVVGEAPVPVGTGAVELLMPVPIGATTTEVAAGAEVAGALVCSVATLVLDAVDGEDETEAEEPSSAQAVVSMVTG